ncbi:glycosyltransferase family 39 protein [Thermithiobacillus plumbiphilus]|uniref:Glycosyltransferase family 39 protein n=1 Tax=Thermithiobacillus plumbiphilus TaxID=1729899 RepID=A0ABU9D6W3_9PROT
MNRPFLKESLLLFVFALLLFGMGTGHNSLWDIDEPNNAQALKEMFARQDFIVPTFNGELRPDKPILNYWVMAGMTRILGFNEWGLRAGAVLFGALLVLLVAWQARRLFDARTGLIAGILAATALHSQVIFRAAVPDPLLIFFSSLGLLSWINGYLHAETRRRDYLISYAALGLAVLAKGPIGLLLPGLIIVLFLAWRRDLPHLWRETHLALGIPLFLLIALPWYGLVWWQSEGQWLSQFLGTHNLSRFSNPMEGHRGPVFFYLLTLPLALLPWSILLPQALVAPFRQYGPRMIEAAPAQAFLLLWALVWIAFFSLAATKLPNYIWPAYPPLFILIAWRMTQALRGELPFQKAGLALSFTVLLLIGVALSVAGELYLPKSIPGITNLWLLGLPFGLAGLAGLLLIWRRQTSAALAGVTLSGVVLTLVLVAYALPQLEVAKPSRNFGQMIQGLQKGEPYTLATWHWFQPSFLFYGGKGDQGVVKLQDMQALKRLLDMGRPVYLALPAAQLRTLASQLEPGTQAYLLLEQRELYSGKDIALLRLTGKAKL